MRGDLEDLRGHVVGRADHGPGVALLLTQQLADAEVTDLDNAIGAAEDVVGLQVSVYYALHTSAGSAHFLDQVPAGSNLSGW